MDLSNFDENEFFWNLVKRADTYYVSINSKSTVLLSFNIFVLTSVVLKANDLSLLYSNLFGIKIIIYTLLISLVICNIISVFYSYLAVKPYLNTDKIFESIIFFGDVSKNRNSEAYYENFNQKKAYLSKDLANQVYELSKGLNNKFHYLNKATLFIMIEFFILFFVLILFLYGQIMR